MTDLHGEAEVAAANEALTGGSADDRVAWALDQFGTMAVIATSLGAEDMVLTDLAAKLGAIRGIVPRAFLLDTGRLPQETYDLFERARDKYEGKVAFDVYFPDTLRVEALVRTKGPNSFYASIEDRKECCAIRKLEPLARALGGAAAWLTGLRRGQAVTRAAIPVLEKDAATGRIKVSPLADWSEEDVWRYVREQGVPTNRLHKAGYPSIGCAPCTRAVAVGEDVRAGRWWWEDPAHKECGLHSRRDAAR